ncbi:MAG: hypothetical protein R6V44_09425 [Paracoccaceae bacterium]
MLQAWSGQLREEALQGVEQGAAGRPETQGPARAPIEPGTDLCVLVRARVVKDHVRDRPADDVALERVRGKRMNPRRRRRCMFRLTTSPARTFRSAKRVGAPRRLQSCVRVVPRLFFSGRPRPGSVERLGPGRLVNGEHDGVGGPRDVEPDGRMRLLGEGAAVGAIEAPPTMPRRAGWMSRSA